MAEITVNANKKLHRIDKKIYGHFIEHLGYCINNGIWMYKNVYKRPFHFGRIRKDLFITMKNLRPPMIRYPGGCFSDGYHWTDGIGPNRPTRINRGWVKQGPFHGANVKNQFGTDEFLQLCEDLGAAPLLNVNFGSGTKEEAAAWVEYCNGSREKRWGGLRSKYGHPEPYDVKYWGIANEINLRGEIGYCKSGSEYAYKYIEFAKEMRRVDPNIKLLAVGSHEKEWNEELLSIAGEFIDQLSIHVYYPINVSFMGVWPYFYFDWPFNTKALYYGIVGGAPAQVEELLDSTHEQILQVTGNDRIKIALDEWNVWYGLLDTVITNYNLRDGIFVATVLNLLQKKANFVAYANFAQMVNCLGMIISWRNNLFVTPSYLAFQVYSTFTREWFLKTLVKSKVFSTRKYGIMKARQGLTYLDCSASIDDNGKKLTLFVVNRHLNEELRVKIKIKGFEPGEFCSFFQIFHKRPYVRNTINHPHRVKIAQSKIPVTPEFEHEFPPHSINAFVFRSLN